MDNDLHNRPKRTDDLAVRIAALSPAKRALLESKLKKNGSGASGQQTIPRSATRATAPLSFAQERLWFLDQLAPGSTVYNIPRAFRLTGRLDSAALERSLNEIMRRHEALRTTFKSVDGTPRQVVVAQLDLPLPVIDFSDRSASDRENEVHCFTAEAARRPFDLSRGPLVRTTLLRLGQEEHILLFNMHHIVSDGWSMAILFRELADLYEAYTNGKPSPLAELPIQYVDYAVWQRNWLKGEVLETQLSYWKKQLENISTLNLPTDRPRPAVQTFHGARESLVLPTDLTQALKATSRKEGASLFMTLLAAFQILLHRLTGQEDIAVGSPIAGRNRSEIEGLIGFFINTLVLRTDLSGNPTFTELLARVRRDCLEAYAHQDVPFEKLLEELRPKRDLSRTPLFQIFLNMVNVAERVKPAGLKIETFSLGQVQSKFDLTIYVRAHNGSLRFNWVYNADLFDRERIQEMVSQYETLLTAISREPSASIHAYSLLTSSAKERLPDPFAPLASEWMGSVHEKFAEHARSFPDRIAITDPSGSWSYAELNARSNELAHDLLGSGIQREEIIAIYAHRSAALPLALLGVLKAGAAFLMLDPAYPPGRLIQYVRGAKPRGFINLEAAGAVPADLEQVLQETIRCRIALPRLPRTEAENPLKNYSTQDPEIEIHPDDLAYISYTSGSTGEPKGVQGRHGPLSHFLPWQAEHFDLTPADRFSLLSGLSHDPLHREILTALWVGATLCIPHPDVIGTSGELAGWMARQQITFAHLTPALGRLLADAAKPDCKIPSLRYAFFIGEKLTRRDVSCLRRLAPQVTNINYYGSTETQRAVSYHELSPQAEEGPSGSIFPVGRGMPGAQLLVLTKAQNLTGIGEVGEIYMRSPHLARGYLGDLSLTHARFITTPFTGQPDDRMYRTGDLGRYLHDGTVEVLGRMDGQINIRGFRVEPGEIEFALKQHPLVREVVVIARKDLAADKPLIAYLVAAQVLPPSIHHELRSFLRQRMPDYMIPSSFVLLDSLPLTPNGKVDSQALPAPNQSRPELEGSFVASRTPVEEMIAQIWAEVLKLERVGIHDSFFELGGHSLLATQVISRLRRALQLEIPLRSLFEAPTIAGLAERVESALRTEQGLQVVSPLLPVSRDNDLLSVAQQRLNRKAEILDFGRQTTTDFPLLDSVTDFLSYAEESLWLLNQIKPGSAWNMQLSYRLWGALNFDALEQSLTEMVKRHDILRTAFKLAVDKPIRIISPSLTVDIPLSELEPSIDSEEQIRRIAADEAKYLFELSQAPLFRARLIRIGEQVHVFIITMHHMITDASSNRIFFRELFALHESFSQGRLSPLKDLPVQYADYAAWIREKRMDSHVAYWQSKLQGFTVTEIPPDKQRTATSSSRGARERIQLGETLTKQVKQLCAQDNVTLFMLMVAAFKILLRRYTGSTDITMGSVVSGRREPELEHVIGMFVNIIVLRSDLSGEPTFRELLRRVREVCLEGYEHQDLPLERLVDTLKLGHVGNRNPFFQVLFDVNNLRPMHHDVPGLRIEPLARPEDTSRYELVLRTPETNDGIAILANYNTDLFSRDWIVELLRQYKFLLDQIIEDADRKIDDYSLKSDVGGLLPDPTAPLDESWEGAVHEIFERNAQRGLDKVAVEDAHEAWSYRELNERSNQLAHHLLAHGVGHEDIVAVVGQRSAALVWALLGIHKAGAAFLVLDPGHPGARVREYVEITAPKGLIQIDQTGKDESEIEDALHGFPLRCMVTLPSLAAARNLGILSNYSKSNPSVKVSADDLAYVIFTSGSTGTPKAVMGRHGPLTHFLPWLTETFGLSENDRFAFLSSLSTNKLQREIFTALTTGGTLYIPKDDDIGNFGRLDDWMRNKEISVVHLTPAMAQLIADTATRIIPSVRRVFFGGDLLRKRDIARTREFMPQAEIANLYNSSETQRGGGCKLFRKESADAEKDIPPLGHGIMDVQLLVMNASGKMAGIGELGEIWVRSPHLARGYIGDDKLSNERFIVNPFTGKENDRIFRTGERGRYLPDGEVEYVSRGENQVSIRGFRVELGEIESVLKSYPAISEAVVSFLESPTDRLVAYLVARRTCVISADEIRVFLKTRLPSYMIPAAFMIMDSLPITATGKVDRCKLPMVDLASRGEEEALVLPRTSLEKEIACVWTNLLGLEKVGIHDDFFELGGHSLLAVRLFAQIEKGFGKKLPLSTLFQGATVAQLANIVSRSAPANGSTSLVTIQPEGTKLPFYCVHDLFGDVLCYMNLARYLGQDQPFYALLARGLDGTEEPFTDIKSMAAHYIEEIQTVQPAGPYALGGLCLGGVVAFEMAQQLRAKGEAVAMVALLDSAVKLKQGTGAWWWSFLRNLPRDLPSWVIGSLQLNRMQWLSLIKLKLRVTETRLREVFNSSAEGSHRNGTLSRIEEMSDLFGFSERHRKIARAQSRASREYKPQVYPGRLTLFRTRMQPFFSSHKPDKGWGRLAAGGLDIRIVPGNHLGMLQEPHVQVLAAQLTACLDGAQTGWGKRIKVAGEKN